MWKKNVPIYLFKLRIILLQNFKDLDMVLT